MLAVATRGSFLQLNAQEPAKRDFPKSLLDPVILSDIRGEVAPIDEVNAIAEALGLMRLDRSNLPADSREIRIYTGAIVGYPHSGLIIRQDGGKSGPVTGRLIRYWPTDNPSFAGDATTEVQFARREAGRCDNPRRGKLVVACTVKFVQQPDWKGLLNNLDSLAAWTIPDESKVLSRCCMFDGWYLRVEAKAAGTYNTYQYHNPQLYKPPDGSNALGVMRLVNPLFRLTVLPSEIRYVEGLYLYGSDTSQFFPCHKPELVGYMSGMLTPVQQLMGDSSWKKPGARSRAFRIEGWVRGGDEESVERGTRTYPRFWQIDTVTRAQEVEARSC